MDVPAHLTRFAAARPRHRRGERRAGPRRRGAAPATRGRNGCSACIGTADDLLAEATLRPGSQIPNMVKQHIRASRQCTCTRARDGRLSIEDMMYTQSLRAFHFGFPFRLFFRGFSRYGAHRPISSLYAVQRKQNACSVCLYMSIRRVGSYWAVNCIRIVCKLIILFLHLCTNFC